tara:strand:+ start:3167 stop:3676 length:510 start_codon:yes stop_codon:yes gene_type:complete
MPVIITPTGQFIDSVTGNPVDLPPQRPDLPMQKMAGAMSDRDMRTIEGARSRENIPANMDMGMNSEMPVPMTVVDQVNALMAMGLTEDQALEAIAIEERSARVDPQNFSGGAKSDMGMGALSGLPRQNEAPMAMPTPRPEDLMMMQQMQGKDRTFNPRDPINSYNAPNT